MASDALSGVDRAIFDVVKITDLLTDEAVLAELGARLARARLAQNTSQRRLGEAAGVSGRTVARVEAGEPASLVNLIRVMRPLGLLEGLDAAIPEHPRVRRRASPGGPGPTA
jgi:DNA-binding XRE family transcriptional regulator